MLLMFGECAIDVERRELRRAGEIIHVEPQVFDLLLYLIDNRKRVATKDDLLAALWQKRIVSDSTLNNRVNAARQAIGDSGEKQQLIRTIPRRGFRFIADVRNVPSENEDLPFAGDSGAVTSGWATWSDKPSIAVLPFENMSEDQKQDYFVDGIVDDITAALSRLRWLHVTSRTSSFQFKQTKLDLREIARRLGVRYVLQGSVRRLDNRVRVAAQLIDGENGSHLWAERYDRELTGVFDIQDELTEAVVGTLYPELSKAEQRRARLKRSENLDAWDAYQQGMWHVDRRTKTDLATAIGCFQRAIELDPDFAPAYWGTAIARYYMVLFGWSDAREVALADALEAGRRAVELSAADAMGHVALAYILFLRRDHLAAVSSLETAIELDPNNYLAPRMLGITLTGAGRVNEALPYFHRALRLSPRDSFVGGTLSWMAMAYFFNGELDVAIEWARRGMRLRQAPQTWTVTTLITILGHLGLLEEAEKVTAELLHIQPKINCSFVRANIPIFDRANLDRYIEGLRKAGLPN